MIKIYPIIDKKFKPDEIASLKKIEGLTSRRLLA